MGAFETTLPNPMAGEEYNVGLAADKLAGIVVKPGEIFSMNSQVGPFTRAAGFRMGPMYSGNDVKETVGGGVCKIATTLYNVTILADLSIEERHQHGMPVPYVPPGQDATVAGPTRDFKFRNDTGAPVLLWADTQGNTLYMAFYGSRQPPKVTWHHVTSNEQPFETIYKTNASLGPGEEKEIEPGMPGMTVKSWITLQYPDGITQERQLGTDSYRPLPKIIERGS
jgi:vancomycin resistance protein YoaR